MKDLMYSFLKDILLGGVKLLSGRLTQEEKEILSQCVDRGEIWQIHADSFGDWVRSGEHDFFNQDDLGYNAIYNEALRRLCGRGLVRHEGGLLYRLTGSGFKVARRLYTTGIKEAERHGNFTL